MKLGIMQPYFFPYIGYWQLINAVDKYIIYDDVNYIKGGWINRNRILVNGNPSYFSLQLDGASPNKKINEIKLNSNAVWKKKLINSLQMSYSKAPFYNEVFPIIQDIILYSENNLAKYLENSLRKLCAFLDINTEIIVSSTLQKNNDLKGKDKVIHICEILDAKEYINAIGGQDMYDSKTFLEHGIKLSFIETNIIPYTQFKNDFVPYLSIIDLLMFNGKEKVKEYLNDYKLIKNSKE